MNYASIKIAQKKVCNKFINVEYEKSMNFIKMKKEISMGILYS